MWKWMFVFSIGCSTILCAEKNVLAFAGSTREGSFNQKLLQEAVQIARQKGAHVTVINLKDYPMPFYNADEESKEGMPANAKKIREMMIQNQIIFISSPEYNSSVPALLKNTLDWASRSETGGSSRDAFKGKKFVLMGAAAGPSGGARALVHLRSIIEDVGGITLSEQVTVPKAYEAFDDQGHLKDPLLKQKLEELVTKALE